MAPYSVPSGAGNVIPQDVKDALQPVLADTWQATKLQGQQALIPRSTCCEGM